MATLTFNRPATETVRFLRAEANVRYWEDAEVNGQVDEDGSLIPLRSGDCWCPTIDLDSGTIPDWPDGVTASIHYKVCDEGTYTLINEAGDEVRRIEGYVPAIMSPGGSGYGDYIIMQIDGAGKIANWRVTLDEFQEDDE